MWQQKQSLTICIWLQDGAQLGPASTFRVLPLPPPLSLWLSLDFSAYLSKIFTLVATDFFGQHDLRSNLTESRYPHWVFLERTQILSGIQFTTHFIEFFFVETKLFVGSTLNVILTRQTSSQRSSRAAGIKRRALGNYFTTAQCQVPIFLAGETRFFLRKSPFLPIDL